MSPDTSPYDAVFYPIFISGCGLALITSVLAGILRGWSLPVLLLMIGIVAFWGGLFLGSDIGFRAWQSIPDPPDEAFADTAPMGALVFGWAPASIFCGFVFGSVRLVKYFLFEGTPNTQHRLASGSFEVESETDPIESNNPYQSPQTEARKQ